MMGEDKSEGDLLSTMHQGVLHLHPNNGNSVGMYVTLS